MGETDTIRYDANGLITAVAQDAGTGDVLMVAHMNREALRQTLTTGQAWYWSRSRGRLWRKGEESGHTQRVVGMRVDCDGDALLLRVEQTGPACHTGRRSCFFRTVVAGNDEPAIAPEPGAPARPSGSSARADGAAGVLNEVAAVLADRRVHPREGSYATRLFADGLARLNEKIMEEAAEVTRAARKETRERLVEETADLWFHSLALLVFLDARPDEVFTELARRRR
jgi:phosphoribosyl-ATP pyrophosphohydrolase/phosphoribosyl-AMP cyclohydrolase